MLRSQKMRSVAAEMDSLRMGSGWTAEELALPQIMIQSTMGESHPGSAHLHLLVEEAQHTLREKQARGAVYTVTDICDGIAQGHDGMNYSLPSRDLITAMVETQIMATPFDGILYISSCDKAIPAHLMSMARLDLPAIFMPGGAMSAGPENLTLEQIGTYLAQYKRGEISEEKFTWYKQHACPTCGACQFMGTASTMQVMGEALGMALPGSALIPTVRPELKKMLQESCKALLSLVEKDICARQILNEKAFENAVMVHAAIAGSTNAVMHIAAIAHEAGISFNADIFDRINRNIPWLVNIKTSGKHPSALFWLAGGVPEVMRQIRDSLNLDVKTVTGETLGENLEKLEKAGYFEHHKELIAERGFEKEEIIRSKTAPLNASGSISILKGNLAPEGAVVKHSAIPKEMNVMIGRARPFNSEEEAYQAVIDKVIQPGDIVIIRYEGPRGSGMPEMFYTTEAVASDPELASSIALLTDGRFSGATRGPAIGHISPEAAQQGPIAFVEEEDLIEINIPERRLSLVGVHGEKYTEEEMKNVIKKRREEYISPMTKKKKGILALYSRHASSAMLGAYMDFEN